MSFEHELATDDICTPHTRIHALEEERSYGTPTHDRWRMMDDDDEDDGDDDG